jgi:ubiquinone/menaquinone biosynthesis C-methylase UbiE
LADAVPYRKHYDDAQARHYAAAKESATATHRGEAALVARAVHGIPREESLLDLPCGAGRMAVVLARLGFTRITAADVSPAMLGLARARFEQERLEIPLRAADAERLPFADREFDNVFCFRLFHHFPTGAMRAIVARELCRVAARRVIVSYLDARSFTSRKRQLERALKPRPPSKFTQTPAEMAALFAGTGFERRADRARLPLWHSLRVLVVERRADP